MGKAGAKGRRSATINLYRSEPCVNTVSPERKEVMPMKQLKLPLEVPEGYEVRFVAYITQKNGTRLYAKQCGKKAFPIVVRVK